MRKFLAAMLAVIMVLSMTACKTDLNEGPDKPTDKSTNASEKGSGGSADSNKEKVKIRLAGGFDPAGSDDISKFMIQKIEEFNAADNGIEVEMVFISKEDDYRNRLSTDIAAGDCPNVFMEYGGSRVVDYVEAGMLLDMTPYYEADPDWYNSVYPTMWTPCKFDSYGHEGIYGIPYNFYQVILLYNQKYLDQCGLEPPTNWDELMNCCEVLLKNGIQPFKLGGGDNYRFGHLFNNLAITKYGPEVAEKIGRRELGYDSPEAKEIYNMMVDAYQKGYFGKNILSSKASEERAFMGAGDMCFTYDLSNRVYFMEDSEEMKAGNLHAAVFPPVDEKYAGWTQGGTSSAFYISTQNASQEEIEASVTLLKYITSQEFMTKMSELEKAPVPMKTAATNSDRSYIYNEIEDVIGMSKGTVQELQNFDNVDAGITIVRNGLATIAQDATADDIAQSILDGYADVE